MTSKNKCRSITFRETGFEIETPPHEYRSLLFLGLVVKITKLTIAGSKGALKVLGSIASHLGSLQFSTSVLHVPRFVFIVVSVVVRSATLVDSSSTLTVAVFNTEKSSFNVHGIYTLSLDKDYKIFVSDVVKFRSC